MNRFGFHSLAPNIALSAIAVILLTASALADDKARCDVTLRALPDAVPCGPILPAAAFDSQRHQVIVFGGADRDSPKSDPATCVLDLERRKWSRIPVTGPSPMSVVAPALVYDPKRDALLLYGGWARGVEKPSGDLWRMGLGTEARRWERIAETKDGPPARNGAVMVLDAKRDCLILHGGDGGPHPRNGYTPLDDLWAFDLAKSTWTRLQPTGDIPGQRWNHAGTCDAAGDTLYVFGGAGYTDDGMVIETDVYALDLATLCWTRQVGSGTLPVPSEGASLTCDTQSGLLVLTGGLSLAASGPAGTDRVHLFDPRSKTWTQSDALGRTRRCGHCAIYDPVGQQHLVIAGYEPLVRGNFYAPGRSLRDALVLKVTCK